MVCAYMFLILPVDVHVYSISFVLGKSIELDLASDTLTYGNKLSMYPEMFLLAAQSGTTYR